MDIDQALHYSGIILDKLENARAKAGSARIHDANCHISLITSYQRLLTEKKTRIPADSLLQSLNDCLEGAENFLARLT